jgi:dihydrodipicolinate synthase/N-acetylneuraminate lyase
VTMAELELALMRKLAEATQAGDYDKAEKIAVELAKFRADLQKSKH